MNEIKLVSWSSVMDVDSTPLEALNTSVTCLWRILLKDLALHLYKIALIQELKSTKHFKRCTFANWTLDQVQADDNCHKKIMFSVEAHFRLDGEQEKLSHFNE